MYFQKIINTFDKDYPEKPKTTFLFINFTLPIAKLSAKLVKWERDWFIKELGK